MVSVSTKTKDANGSFSMDETGKNGGLIWIYYPYIYIYIISIYIYILSMIILF